MFFLLLIKYVQARDPPADSVTNRAADFTDFSMLPGVSSGGQIVPQAQLLPGQVDYFTATSSSAGVRAADFTVLPQGGPQGAGLIPQLPAQYLGQAQLNAQLNPQYFGQQQIINPQLLGQGAAGQQLINAQLYGPNGQFANPLLQGQVIGQNGQFVNPLLQSQAIGQNGQFVNPLLQAQVIGQNGQFLNPLLQGQGLPQLQGGLAPFPGQQILPNGQIVAGGLQGVPSQFTGIGATPISPINPVSQVVPQQSGVIRGCGTFRTCLECRTASWYGCSWNPGTGCTQSWRQSVCTGVPGPTETLPECAAYRDCVSCTNQAGCVFFRGQCLYSAGPSCLQDPANCVNYPAQCPAAPATPYTDPILTFSASAYSRVNPYSMGISPLVLPQNAIPTGVNPQNALYFQGAQQFSGASSLSTFQPSYLLGNRINYYTNTQLVPVSAMVTQYVPVTSVQSSTTGVLQPVLPGMGVPGVSGVPGFPGLGLRSFSGDGASGSSAAPASGAGSASIPAPLSS